MNVRPHRRAMDWVMATLVVAMSPQMASMPIHLAVTCLLPVAWRVMAEQRGWSPPNTFIRLILAAAAVVMLFATYGGLLGRRAAVSLLTIMLSLKLVEAWRLRDARVLVTVAIFLSATQFLFDSGLIMIAYVAAVLACALVALIHLERAEAFAHSGGAPPTSGSMAELKYSGRLIALALPVAFLLFLLFPRWGSPLWGVPEAALDARSGLSDSMSPGTIQSLFMDDTPAFRVEFDGPRPERHELYWRGPVFWNFDGRTWKGGFLAHVPNRERALPREAEWFYKVQMEPTEQHWLFALDYPAIQPPGTLLTIDYQIYSARAITSLREYTMASDPGFVDTPTLSPVLRSEAL
ncbi:MAG: DUF3488 domain-containing protein [Xanthomonadales bacterium]|nr:DUF3488 domain-containing protein [Xanthomonadales bacterium]